MNAEDHLHGQPRPTPEQVAWVFHHLNEHYGEGGAFRRLIYERMGFDQSAYGVLCGPGMNLSNLVNYARQNREVDQAMLDCHL